MAKHTYPRSLRSIENTGFSANSAVEGARLINRDGNANLRKSGIPFYERISIYHSLLRMPRWRFLLIIFGFYTSINLIFATLYFLIGTEHLTSTSPLETPIQQFGEAFFFSAQTLTTVGYGHIAPVGMVMNAVASLESLVGILAFAVVTGILYGRFSRPKAYLLFSHNMLVSPFKGGRGLMLRLATYKNNHLTDVEAIVTGALHAPDAVSGKRVTRFFTLKLDIKRITSLALNWTLVHPIDEESPLYGFSEQEFMESGLEIIVNIKAFDDHFSNTVQQRTSYTANELVYGGKFLSMYGRPDDENYTLLELDKINEHERAELPDAYEVPEMTPPTAVAARV